jgi:hypothetical protein
LHKDFPFFFIVALEALVKQEVSIPSLFLYMSFELDTCSLRDVIEIVCVRETLSLHSITETSARSSRQREKEEDTRISAQTDPPLACFALRKEKREVGNAG